MLRHLVCGSSFHPEEDAQLRCSTRTSRKNSFSRWGRENIKNPYSNRGLDKFSQLMADLDEKRQKIYLQRGSEDIALIRFVNSSSGGFVPVVVKLKDDKKHNSKEKKASTQYSKRPHESSDTRKEAEEMELQRFRRQEKKSVSRGVKKNQERQPSWNMLVVVIIILLFLAIFGRSFAILCTCIGWYFVPTLTGEKSSLRTSMEKKEHVRKPSEKKTILSN